MNSKILVMLLISTLILGGCEVIYIFDQMTPGYGESPSFGCLDGPAGAVEKLGCPLMEGSKKDHCYQDAAVRSGNADLCKKIEFGPPKDKCYLRVAARTGKDMYCEELSGKGMGYTQQECYHNLAVTYGSKHYCDLIKTTARGWSKEKCLNAVKELPEGEYEEPVLHEEELDSVVNTQCRSVSDCPPVCKGNILVSRMCDLGTDRCAETSTKDCSTEKFTPSKYPYISRPKSCINDNCQISEAELGSVLAEINSNEIKRLLALRESIQADIRQKEVELPFTEWDAYAASKQPYLDKIDSMIATRQRKAKIGVLIGEYGIEGLKERLSTGRLDDIYQERFLS